MDYICDICKKAVKGDVKTFIDHTEGHIVEAIKKRNPDWIQEDGICPKCLEYYKNQLKGDDK